MALPAIFTLSALTLATHAAAQTSYEPYFFSTYAGRAPFGSADGTGSAALFNQPSGVAVDGAGNLYVADAGNNTIRKITPGGVVSTLAGQAGSGGSADGTGSAARFNYPKGVAVDSGGNVYVADAAYSTIRKITPGGVVSTLAGLAGSDSGSADGTGSAARFYDPSGLAVDSAGNVYVADTGNDMIRKITPDGVVSTLAGQAGQDYGGYADGIGSAARFARPAGVAVDRAGNVYVADDGNDRIRKITSGGVVSTLAGSALFADAHGVAVDSAGNVYVANQGDYTIRKITSGGVVSTVAGSAYITGSADGTGSVARFFLPTDVAVDSAGSLYVTDYGNNTIRKINSGGVVSTLAGMAGGPGSADGTGRAARFDSPSGVAVDGAANLYVGDFNNNTIRKISSGGEVSTFAGSAGEFGSANGAGDAARFNRPAGVAADTAGNVYVADTFNDTIRKITSGGVVSTLAGLAGNEGSADGTGGAARFSYPYDVAVDSVGNVYVADAGNHTIRKITSGGVVSTLAGLAGNVGSADGTGGAARFYYPTGVAVDSTGNVYVADEDNHTIRKITAAGGVTTLAGFAGNPGSEDGTANAARFSSPVGVAVDKAGNLYVSDAGNGTIRKITSGGVVSTIAALAGSSGSEDGTGSAVRFAGPAGVAVDSAGTVYVVDSGNNTVRVGRKVQPAAAVNISTRMDVGAGDNALIAGFIITGNAQKKVILRAIGPSLSNAGTPVPGRLMDTVLELHGGDGSLILKNDSWRSTQRQGIIDSGIPPSDEREAAIVATLQPGSYSAILSGKNNESGIGLLELYDLDTAATSQLAQISTRGLVETGDNVMIGGFILAGGSGTNVLVRAIGPELPLTGALQDTVLELRDGSGTLLASNDDWQSDQKKAIIDTGVPPSNNRESAILRNLTAGNYTAIIQGKGDETGIALVEVYVLQ